MVPVIAFVGSHNAGKTTLLSRIIHSLQQMEIECAVVKHSHHLLTPDNSDSGRLYAAGAQQVYLSTPQETLIYRREQEQPLEKLLAQIMSTVDIIFLEGLKQSVYPKIEVIRSEVDPEPLKVTNVIARITDCQSFDDGIPQFSFDQEAELLQFILEHIKSAHG